MRGTDRCPEVKGTEQFASHTFQDASDLVGSEDPEMRSLPPELTKDGAAVMIGLPPSVAKRLLSSTLNTIAARTMVQGPDTSLKHGIELQGLFCCQEGWNPQSVSDRKQFWEVHRMEKPNFIVYEFPEFVKEMLGLTRRVFGREWRQSRSVLLMFLLGIAWQIGHGRWILLSVSDINSTWMLRQSCDLVNHFSLDPVKSMRVDICQGGFITNAPCLASCLSPVAARSTCARALAGKNCSLLDCHCAWAADSKGS